VGTTIGNLASPPSRRETILEAAESIFAECGYDRARLEDIAQQVGIRRASLLYHFRDKTTLYAAVLDSLLGSLLDRYRRVLDVDAPPGQRLESSLDVWLDFIAERPALVRLMLRELADGVSDHSRPFAERAVLVLIALGDVVAAGQSEQSLRRTSALHVMTVLAGASTFLLLGGAIYSRDETMRFPALVDREQHRELLLAILRKLLGTGGPRPVTGA
jgi:TetR/AcrR family transcriptional regulator